MGLLRCARLFETFSSFSVFVASNMDIVVRLHYHEKCNSGNESSRAADFMTASPDQIN